MKRFLRTLIVAILTLSVCLGLVACGGESVGKWKGTSLKSWGTAKTQGGFMLETDNYIYFINGQASYTDDNAYGTPVKGSLMVIKTQDFASGNFEKAEIAVPKLFNATDYKAGLYIYGDYVYYGTPNVNKDSSGNAASSEMTFFKTKLDGTEHKELFTRNSLSEEYRVVNSASGVEILYYDADNTAVVSYNVNSGSTKTIAKTDITADESMTGYKFLNVVDGQPVVVFTNEVYSEKYYAEKAEASDYTRASSYGKIYTYTAGASVAEEVVCGDSKHEHDGDEHAHSHDVTYTINYVDGNYVFYTAGDHDANKVYGTLISEIKDQSKRKEINDSSVLTSATLIKSLEEVYIADTTAGSVVKTTLVGSQATIKETVILTETISSILDVRDGYLYFFNEGTELVRQELSNPDANVEKISQGTVSTTWYAPRFITIDGDLYVVYLDSSVLGSYYLSTVNLTDSVLVEEDTDDDGENDSFYFDSSVTVGKMLAKDEAKKATTALNNAIDGSQLKYEINENGELILEKYDKFVSIYAGLSQDAKDALDDDFNTKMANVKKAVELTKLYAKLDGFHKLDDKADVSEALKTAYNEAKVETNRYTSEEFAEIRIYIPTNLKYEYQQAKKLLED